MPVQRVLAANFFGLQRDAEPERHRPQYIGAQAFDAHLRVAFNHLGLWMAVAVAVAHPSMHVARSL